MNEQSIDRRLEELGLKLPEPPTPLAFYRPWTISGQLLFLSGQLPMVEGRLAATGKIGAGVSPDQGKMLAQTATLNGLAHVRNAIGSLDHVRQCLKVVGYINSATGFTRQPAILDGASELLVQIFGDKGRHARVAVGVSELPLDAPIEIEFLFEIEPAGNP